MRWTEISDQPQNSRCQALSSELKQSNFENTFEASVIPTEFLDLKFFDDDGNCDRFRTYMKEIKKNFDQIRVGGFFREKMDILSDGYPADLMQVKVLDSLVKTENHWWPRNQFYHGFIHALTPLVKNLDYANPILIVGSNAESKTIIAALIKMGFSRFNLTDVDSEACHLLVQELSRSFFSVRFEMTEIGYITQLPNIYSIAVNTLSGQLDETSHMALIYFNFLPKGALWIESSPQADKKLASEAQSFGFKVVDGASLVSNSDFVWARSVLNCLIDMNRYKENLKTVLK